MLTRPIAHRLIPRRLTTHGITAHRISRSFAPSLLLGAGVVLLSLAGVQTASAQTAGTGTAGAAGADLIVSANSGGYVRVDGKSTYPRAHPPSSLVVIDASQSPPRIVNSVEGVTVSIQGPPQAVAITPDGRTAFVGAATRIDLEKQQESNLGTFQIVDLTRKPARLGAVVNVGTQVNGLAVNPAGTLLLASTLDGNVYAYAIDDQALRPLGATKVSDGWLGSLAITADGRTAIVARRTQGGAAVLDLDGTTVSAPRELISTGISPYTVDVTADGRWAVVGNAGLAGLPAGTPPGGNDSLTVIDTSARPFRALKHLTIPATPESVAISPDGRWIVAQSLGGANLSSTTPGWNRYGRVTLFSLGADGSVTQLDQLPDGTAAQGVVFGRDNQTVIVQNNVEKNLAVYAIRDGRLVDTKTRLPLAAGPVSIRSQPR